MCSPRARQPEVVVKSSSDVQQRQCCFNNEARLDIVLNAPEDILDQFFMNDVN